MSVKVTDSLRQRLVALSESRERSVHWLMKQAIEAYVDNEERSDTLRQETLARWEEVEAGKIKDVTKAAPANSVDPANMDPTPIPKNSKPR